MAAHSSFLGAINPLNKMLFALFALLISSVHSFHVYMPTVNATALAESYGVTASCLQALNTTINCDPMAVVAVTQVDRYQWTSGNLTDLCTATCDSDITNWLQSVESACSGMTIPVGGYRVEASYLPWTYRDGYNLACLKSTSNAWCLLESYTWQGKDTRKYAEDYCGAGDSNYDPPECYDQNFIQNELHSTNTRMVDLYDESMLCSDCFLKVWRHRVQSHFSDSGNNWPAYLESQFTDMMTACSTTMTYSTVSRTLVQGTNTPIPSSTTPPPAATTCAGVQVTPSANTGDCQDLAEQYHVATGYLVAVTGNYDCSFNTTICLPNPCDIQKVYNYHTCEILAQQWTTPDNNITNTLVQTWNPFLLGTCDKLVAAQYMCKSPPGGFYTQGAPVNAPTATTGYYSTATPPVPTSTGTIANCGKYYTVTSGDTCQSVCLANAITAEQFRTWNTQIDATCTNLWLGYAYCVAPVSTAPVSTDGTCGPSHNNAICAGSGFRNCCSRYGNCGSDSSYCGAGQCYSGDCEAGNDMTTQDGTCGPANHNWICGNSAFGDCCSTSGYCGSTSDYCGAGNCYSGNCDTDEGGVSTDGSCGPQFAGNKICTGSQFGACCSTSGYCGDTSDYCGVGNCYSGACD